jgi:hypothetical protein
MVCNYIPDGKVFIFGILIGTEAPGISKNLPPPRIGIWERINIGACMRWVIALLRRQNAVEVPRQAQKELLQIKTPA